MAVTDSSIPFQNLPPARYLWVSSAASSVGDGSQENPFSTIQAAVKAATPGTAIMVKAGTYIENIKLPSGGDYSTLPTWLVSADGPQAAHIIAANSALPVIKGLDTDNYVIAGFQIEGGYNGIQFSQSGTDFHNLVNNIVVQGNTILNSKMDGVKISQADNVHIIDNTISGAGDQGVDFVAVNHSVIARNDVSNVTGVAAMFAKAGSTDVLMKDNYVHHVSVDGISIGGWSDDGFSLPDQIGYYEAKDVVATGNYVADVGKDALIFLGALDSSATGNYLQANPNYDAVIGVAGGNPAAAHYVESHNIDISGNVLTHPRKGVLLRISQTDQTSISFHDNTSDGVTDLIPGTPSHQAWSLAGADVSEWTESAPYSATIKGTAGNDNLIGTGQADLINGGNGNDTMTGGTGDDTYVVSATGDKVVENVGGGIDTILLDAQMYLMADQVENLTARTPKDASVMGNALSNIINGGDGSDVIVGGQGDDLLHGGKGNDIFVIGVGDGNDVIQDFSLGDKIELTNESFHSFGDLQLALTQNVGDAVLNLGNGQSLTLKDANVSSLTADSFDLGDVTKPAMASGPQQTTSKFGLINCDDWLKGTPGNDYLDGRLGNDVLEGGAGDDTYVIRTGNERIIETANGGTDTAWLRVNDYALTANVENVSVSQKAESSVDFQGNALANIMTGGTGDDTMAGLGGADLLIGGRGNDHFVYSSASESTGPNYDTVLGFDAAADRFEFSTRVSAVDAPISGALSTASFDSDLAAAVNGSNLGAHHAALFEANAGSLAGQEFLVVDANGVVGYQAGQDFVVHMQTGFNMGSFGMADFIGPH